MITQFRIIFLDIHQKEHCMTDHFLQKLEEKVMTVLAELKELRSEINRLKKENTRLTAERNNDIKRLQELVALLDSTNIIKDNRSVEAYTLEIMEGA